MKKKFYINSNIERLFTLLGTLVLILILNIILANTLLKKIQNDSKLTFIQQCEDTVEDYVLALQTKLENLESEIDIIYAKLAYKTLSPEAIKELLTNEQKILSITFTEIIYSDAKGNTYNSYGENHSIADRPYFKIIMEGKTKFYVSRVLESKHNGEPIIVFARPLYDETNRITGVLCAGCTIETVSSFIDKIKILVEMEQRLQNEELTVELLKEAKRIEFPDNVIAKLNGKLTEEQVRSMRYENGIIASYKIVDTCAAEFDAMTPYYYSVYGSENEAVQTTGRKKVLVLGSGPIRIGQGVEFDYCSVHATWAFAKEGWETVIVNNNPETVSTDFDIADKLYFEPLTNEDVESIVNLEKPDGAIVQFGGQTAIKLTEHLMKIGVPILGTKAEDVDAAEDRELFDEILEQTHIPRAAGGTVFTAEEAKEVANRLGYPVLVRPSYVLGGQGMQIAFNDDEIEKFMDIINQIAQDHPILVDKYLQGKEIEVDAICDGENILIPGIMEHIERTGIHSGDSISVYPAHTITQDIKDKIVDYTERLAKALHVLGMINIQFIAMDGEVYVIEVNPRSSRTVPYISKVTGIPIVDLAAKAILGHKITEMGYKPGLQPEADYIAIKMPVFSFEKLRGAEISLGPEMKSTGECLGIAKTFEEALYKAFLGAGVVLPKHKQMIITVRDSDKPEALEVAKRFEKLGYKIYATRSTAKYLQAGGVDALQVNKITQESPNVMDLILGHKIDLVIDTPTQGHGDKTRDGFLIRRNAIETGINCITAMDTAVALATSLESATTEYTLVDIAKI